MSSVNPRNCGRVALLVWDTEGTSPVGDWTTVLWREYACDTDPLVVSIPQLVEQESDELRARYLAWIHDLGEARIDGRSVIDHLSLRSGFSYWWVGSLAQKFNTSGTSQIDDALKALALEMLVVAGQVESIVLISGNHRLADCVQGMCLRKGLSYEWRPVKALANKYNLRSLYQSLPQAWRAFIYLAWNVLKAIPLFLQKRSAIPEYVGEVMFIDVLVHLDKRVISTGSFISNYWTTLLEKLTEWKIKSNWLHIYYRHPAVSSTAKAQRLIQRFNKSSDGLQFHALIERSLNLRFLGKVLRDYFTVSRSLARLNGICTIRPAGSDLNLWSLHFEEWRDSLCGKEAMINCLRLSLVEEAVSRFPPQRLGIYISENQPWEIALLYAWKAAGHGTLIGTPHTAVRFWDLRYHYDARSYLRNTDNALPLPDVLAVNGPAARESVLAGGYPPERVTEVEALRFFHLLRSQSDNITRSSSRNELRILVCGDFLAETNRRILAWLEIATRSLPHDTIYMFKPHPAYPFNSADYPKLKLEMSDAPLADLLSEFDVVFTSNITSAAVDAYCSGVSVIQMLDGSTFNVSPLRGLNGVMYVTNPMELAVELGNAKYRKRVVAEPFFYLDEELPRWRKLLGLHADRTL